MRTTLPRMTRVRVPPIKSQGIKTKLVPLIMSSINWKGTGRWVEPFLGSGVVAFNVLPQQALLCDKNPHIILLYQSIKDGMITSAMVRRHLEREGERLLRLGEDHYYAVRERFNRSGDPLDFLFLNRSCFNGVMRFNKKGMFNVPFCRKPDRFRAAYVTKICNQVAWLEERLPKMAWEFAVRGWEETIKQLEPNDLAYFDPPYIGRHADYYSSWSENDADELAKELSTLKCGFAYSMWAENKYRKNEHLTKWFSGFPIYSYSHFYHVGPSEALRNKMQEALVVSQAHAVPEEESKRFAALFKKVPYDDENGETKQEQLNMSMPRRVASGTR